MFESWCIVKFDYTTPENSEIQTGMDAHESLTSAEKIFSQLEFGYLFGMPILVKDGKRITVANVQLYRVFKFGKHEAMAALKAGEGDLLSDAQGVSVSLEQPS